MSGAPSGWQTPKTNWQSADVVLPEDLNRVEGNAYATELGERTIDPAQAPSGNIGTLRQLLDWLANRIKALSGAANWYSAPATTLAAAKSHMDSTANPHAVTKAQVGLGNVDNLSAASIRAQTTNPLGREVVSSFPTSGNFDGRTILLTQADAGKDPGPYTYFDGEWL